MNDIFKCILSRENFGTFLKKSMKFILWLSWKEVIISSSNGFVLPDSQPLPEAILANTYTATG